MLELRMNYNRNVVCAYARGPKITHYLGVDGGQLTTLRLDNREFDKEFYVNTLRDPKDFAVAYTKNEAARKMIPLSGSAVRVLAAILRGQPTDEAVASSLNQMENIMASTDSGFRKPDGPVAKVHAFLDSKRDQIKAGTVSRKELIDAMEAKGLSVGTITTQCGVWAKNNGITFVRPAEATEKKAAKRKRAAKKAKAAVAS